MKTKLLTLAAAGLIASQANAGVVTTDGEDIVITTKGGFEAKTTDGDYSFKIGGRVMVDFNSYDGVINKEVGETGSDLFFRRARLEIKGHAKEWGYEVAYNLTGDDRIDQLFTTYTGFGNMTNLSIGQQKEFFGLDDTGSSKWTVAIEPSFVSGAFDTGNNMGVKLHGANDFLTYSLGVYKDSIEDSDNSLELATTGRVVIRPIYENGRVLHLGAGVTQRNGEFEDISSRLGVRGGEDKTANKLKSEFTAGIGEGMSAYNLEFAFASGPLQIMAEYFNGTVDAPGSVAGSDDINVDGYYGQVSYFLTGESRKYKTATAAFDSVTPANASGAWEVFANQSKLNADTGSNITLTGGEDADITTLGVNYYMNSNVKLALNYVAAQTDAKIGGEDNGDALVGRLQLVF